MHMPCWQTVTTMQMPGLDRRLITEVAPAFFEAPSVGGYTPIECSHNFPRECRTCTAQSRPPPVVPCADHHHLASKKSWASSSIKNAGLGEAPAARLQNSPSNTAPVNTWLRLQNISWRRSHSLKIYDQSGSTIARVSLSDGRGPHRGRLPCWSAGQVLPGDVSSRESARENKGAPFQMGWRIDRACAAKTDGPPTERGDLK